MELHGLKRKRKKIFASFYEGGHEELDWDSRGSVWDSRPKTWRRNDLTIKIPDENLIQQNLTQQSPWCSGCNAIITIQRYYRGYHVRSKLV